MTIRFVFVTPAELGPYVEGLRAIERATEYPIGDGTDAFTIDHGAEYSAFFTSLGEEVKFLLALDGDRVVGNAVGMYRNIQIRGRRVRAVYGADWKMAPDQRGTGLARQMMVWAATHGLTDPSMLGWRYGFVAAMRGAHGDVMRAARGLHPAKFARPAASLAVYFVDPGRLADLSLAGAPPPPDAGEGVDLSYETAGQVEPPGLVSTAGRKDLRLVSTGKPWPLVHLPYGPSRWLPTWGAYLQACGRALAARQAAGPAIACFAIDERLSSHIAWLAAAGIERGAACTVYALDLTFRARRAGWLHLGTSEI